MRRARGTGRIGLSQRLGLHRHRVEPDLSAVVAFPTCRCGATMWPTEGRALPTDHNPAPEPTPQRRPAT
jgi:hypothetical protein